MAEITIFVFYVLLILGMSKTIPTAWKSRLRDCLVNEEIIRVDVDADK